ncbi:glucan biosynthesis protein [Aminivibrio sp.]|uniref:glucan biosynthesis protein n=1 Tax=Aminivibrio sp. TaxID=1872489 RepID=UPI0025BD05E8|nr:glucan biosynthesis protein G [Aminivibrio sp.]MDK2958741.1 periplasmic glucans biosynthesis protein [Synergistaceae bacterium]
MFPCIRRHRSYRQIAVAAFLAAAFCLLPASPGASETPPGDAVQSGPAAVLHFSFDDVKQKAEELASRPFENPEGQVPDFLLNISYDQWRKIRFRPSESLWRAEGLPFEVQFFHPGLFYNRLVTINIIENGRSEKLPFSSSAFDYGDNEFASKVASTPLDFAGFRIHCNLNSGNYKDEAVVFLGASYFRAVARDVQYGLSARGLAVDTALQSGEEFPYFREFWIEKPAPESTLIRIYALLDSPGLTGAYAFTVIPGKETVMDAESTLFLRKDLQKLGIAPLTSMFLYGETENGRQGDYRPEVHDSDGLLMHTESGEWIWRPLANPSRLAVILYPQVNPAGFGLMQRDGTFDHYQDLEARYEKRPSLWIEPRGSWGPGRVELVEIPSELEIHDNMVAYWVPDKIEETGADGLPINDVRKYPGEMSFAYRMRWMHPSETVHPLGRAAASRMAAGNQEGTVRFVLDFEGGQLADLPGDSGLTSVVTVGEGGRLLEKQLLKNEVTGGWRLVLHIAVDPKGKLKTIFPTQAARPYIRITALLKKGENLPDPLTETWTYDLHP